MHKQRALVVDDSEVLRRLIEMCLKPAGFEIAAAGSGGEALAMAAEFDPDLILLDIGLPDMTGWEVLAAIRESEGSAAAKVLILSGYEDVHTEAKRLGADGALVKPFRNDELRKVAVEMVSDSFADTAGAGAPF
ncbi:MAG: response regulator [bacterium]|nr:response regulator [bacterium]MCP4965938.1 response regulator [bacterium]